MRTADARPALGLVTAQVSGPGNVPVAEFITGGPDELKAWLEARLPSTTDLTRLNFYCSAELPDRVLCLLTFRGASAQAVAGAIGGQAFGLDSAVISIPVDGGFRCHRRHCGQPSLQSCDCVVHGLSEPPMLDR